VRRSPTSPATCTATVVAAGRCSSSGPPSAGTCSRSRRRRIPSVTAPEPPPRLLARRGPIDETDLANCQAHVQDQGARLVGAQRPRSCTHAHKRFVDRSEQQLVGGRPHEYSLPEHAEPETRSRSLAISPRYPTADGQ